MYIQWLSWGEVRENIVTNQYGGGLGYSFAQDIEQDDPDCPGNWNIDFSDNILYNWGGEVAFEGYDSMLDNISFTGNEIQQSDYSGRILWHEFADNIDAVSSANNKFWSATNQFGIGGSNVNFTTWRTQIGDTTSTLEEISYPDPDRNLGTYHTSLGKTGTFDAFIAEARRQSRFNWRESYTADAVNDYIRAGFGIGDLTCDITNAYWEL